MVWDRDVILIIAYITEIQRSNYVSIYFVKILIEGYKFWKWKWIWKQLVKCVNTFRFLPRHPLQSSLSCFSCLTYKPEEGISFTSVIFYAFLFKFLIVIQKHLTICFHWIWFLCLFNGIWKTLNVGVAKDGRERRKRELYLCEQCHV